MLPVSRSGRETGSISYTHGFDFMNLSYSVGTEHDKAEVREAFPMSFTEQPYGGRRRWFVCIGCGQRCRVLLGGRYFRCRQCYGATYPSQYETIRCRGLSKAEKAREKVGAEPGIANPWPRKPKGMHWNTYRRLEALYWEGVLEIERVLSGRLV